jgi:hypothetical protein
LLLQKGNTRCKNKEAREQQNENRLAAGFDLVESKKAEESGGKSKKTASS